MPDPEIRSQTVKSGPEKYYPKGGDFLREYLECADDVISSLRTKKRLMESQQKKNANERLLFWGKNSLVITNEILKAKISSSVLSIKI